MTAFKGRLLSPPLSLTANISGIMNHLTAGHVIVILWSLRLLVGASVVSSPSCGKKIISLIVNIVRVLCKLLMKKGEKNQISFLELFGLLKPKTLLYRS